MREQTATIVVSAGAMRRGLNQPIVMCCHQFRHAIYIYVIKLISDSRLSKV